MIYIGLCEAIPGLQRSRSLEEKRIVLTDRINKYMRRGENESDTCKNFGVNLFNGNESDTIYLKVLKGLLAVNMT